VTAVEAYELITQGGPTDFARLIAACESFGPYCLIGGLAVNCYVELVYTLDADVVVLTPNPFQSSGPPAPARLRDRRTLASIERAGSGKQTRFHFTTDERHQPFLARSVAAEVLGVRVSIACLERWCRDDEWRQPNQLMFWPSGS
jgi:hypothetical protein